MTAVRPLPAVLAGRFVRLEPLTADLLPRLYRAIAVPEVFAGGYGGGPAGLREDLDGFTEWARRYYRWNELPFAVRLLAGTDAGTVVGTSSLADLELHTESAQLGWTAYSPSVWGTAVNPETKLLLLGHAFAAGLGRITIQADARNERSRAAISGIGAAFEGIRRRDRRRADGSWRDTAVYSLLAEEWPQVRAGLEQRLDRFAGPAGRAAAKSARE
ncbi:GNAT family N-acetyltransferase [Arthrobacter sp. zg-Y20]|uniref:GNAT family N-acetyltransferase n=1 Tax=unclassified Arthrobacter TaxID=235627 RepID=UPI001D15CD2A|nr:MULTISPECIES: GNAT family protein [unclassified Arthrobacter]MCC3275496.1 GNAT family N-acetyltransferase [Arthrobacter sp. zg-Y20]MDK1315653.1 GNAT family protein [Arthrobacter sp. zg.Y20]WIB06063.1 GNAT family protein [Arthrobacter sp. zg-Y20]